MIPGRGVHCVWPAGPRARWAVVLAAGDGRRLGSLTTDQRGIVTPKQFCTLRGGRSLLEEALARAEGVVPRERIIVVVAAQHEPFWHAQLAHLPKENVVVQPKNRGTAPGLLLPMLTILARDPDPILLVLPSDHHVDDEGTLASSMLQAFVSVDRRDADVVLLGISPQAANSDYGWIVPGRSHGALAPVQAFVEKPDRVTATRLMQEGGIWNSFILVLEGRAMIALIDRSLPGLPGQMREALLYGADALPRLYDALASADLSRDVFERAPDHLWVLPVPPCGWTDLGTPQRVAECLARDSRTARMPRNALPARTVMLNLEHQLAGLP